MKEMSRSQIVRFQSYNPYASRYPQRRVVSREALHLIKRLRAEGYSVVVEPDDGTKLCHLTEKGFREIISDPVITFIIGIPVGLIVNLFSSWLYDKFRPSQPESEVNIVLGYGDSGSTLYYNAKGEKISDERFKLLLLEQLDKKARHYEESQRITPPDMNYPYPIYIEHTPKVIGWGHVYEDDKGLRVEVKISDDEVLKKIDNGELTGFSIGGLVTQSFCKVCRKDYVDCDHISSQIYGGVECSVEIAKVLVADISVVKNPVQPLALIDRKQDIDQKTT